MDAMASADGLSPATLSARNHLTSELLRTLSRVAASNSTTNLIARSLTATLSLTGIRSLANVSNLVGPIGYPVLYLRQETRNAAPKCISGRTSYHGV